MARPSAMKNRFTTMVSLEREDYEAFEKLVGQGNISKELRAYIKERVDLEKNEQALSSELVVDPLNLSILTQRTNQGAYNPSITSRQSTLFEAFALRDKRDEISKFINTVNDTGTLNQLEQNAKCMLKVAETRRQRLVYLKL